MGHADPSPPEPPDARARLPDPAPIRDRPARRATPSEARRARERDVTPAGAGPEWRETLVTVVIPVHNGERFITTALDSVLAQSVGADEILVVDDASTDGTAAIVEAYRSRHPHVRLVRHGVNGGPSRCRNTGLIAAHSSYVAFLDADDRWMPRHLELALQALERHPECALAACGASRLVQDAGADDRASAVRVMDDPVVTLLDDNFITQSATVVRRSAALACGGYDDDLRYGEDYRLWMRMALAGARFAIVDTTTCIRTPHAEQVSRRNPGRMLRSAWATRRMAALGDAGTPHRLDRATIAILQNAARRDLSTAWSSRKRRVLRTSLRAAEWVPESESTHELWRRRAGWQWPFWRAIAWCYDTIPMSPAIRGRMRDVIMGIVRRSAGSRAAPRPTAESSHSCPAQGVAPASGREAPPSEPVGDARAQAE